MDAQAPRAVSMPAAALEQGDVRPVDFLLTDEARAHHPAVRWWWGERVKNGRNGAYCYLCEKLVAEWQRRYPTTGIAIAAILEHRDSHGEPQNLNLGIETGAKFGPGVASGKGGSQ